MDEINSAPNTSIVSIKKHRTNISLQNLCYCIILLGYQIFCLKIIIGKKIIYPQEGAPFHNKPHQPPRIPKAQYYYRSDDDDSIIVGGNYKQSNNLNLAVIYSAGHLVPTTQLAISRRLLKDLIFAPQGLGRVDYS
jgi:hypothetical protein